MYVTLKLYSRSTYKGDEATPKLNSYCIQGGAESRNHLDRVSTFSKKKNSVRKNSIHAFKTKKKKEKENLYENHVSNEHLNYR